MIFFQFLWCGHAQDGAMPSFSPDSKSFLLGLSNEVLFVSEFISEGDQKKQKVVVKT